jgi:ubiquitin-like protein ATG12
VRFRAIGNAPILKQNFYKITASNKFQAVIQFLRKELQYKAEDPLVCVSMSETVNRISSAG